MGGLEERILVAVAARGLPAATSASDMDSYDVFWAVVMRRRGKRLVLRANDDPSIFAALEHGKNATIDLGELSDAELDAVIRRAAHDLPLPDDARAIPFSLLEGGGAHRAATQRIKGLAFPRAFLPLALAFGHSDAARLEVIAVGETELIVASVDQFKDFGAIRLRSPLERLQRADLDAGTLVLVLPDRTERWSLEDNGEDWSRVIPLLERLGVPIRKLVRVSPSERRWT